MPGNRIGVQTARRYSRDEQSSTTSPGPIPDSPRVSGGCRDGSGIDHGHAPGSATPPPVANWAADWRRLPARGRSSGRLPELARDKNAVLELIYTEFVLREERGERPSPTTGTPGSEWEADLRELFQVNAHPGRRPRHAQRHYPRPDAARRAAPVSAVLGSRRGLRTTRRTRPRRMGVVYEARQVSPPDGRPQDDPGGARGPAAARPVPPRGRGGRPAPAPKHRPGVRGREFDGIPFFTMEYVQGGTLARELAAGATRTPGGRTRRGTRARSITPSRAVVHRDLKPANILLQRHPEAPRRTIVDRATIATGERRADSERPRPLPKITDFGLAKLLTSEDRRPRPEPSSALRLHGSEQASGDASASARGRRVRPRRDPLRVPDRATAVHSRPGWSAIREVLDNTPIPPSRLRGIPGIWRRSGSSAWRSARPPISLRAARAADDLRRFQDGRPISRGRRACSTVRQVRPAGTRWRLVGL